MAENRTRVYEDANDQHVRALIVYAKSADSKLYYEPEYTTQVKESEALRFFMMDSLVIKTTDGFSRPVFVNTASHKVVTVTRSSSTVTGTEWNVLAD